ncbi:MAG: mechanosensitive ion channel protein MscS [Gallionellales bacterium 35-53-114]|jgi:small conductance mechanosensitive channel|nr:MAG: mechanosensitive ion channel protein MscS [Gallionellales bacterium 35-53-114]OYZ64857.1 MAG: mechanosensitive ion channel protein MscS [Gallionellales bacterium 24-53-125]OZB07605.1 MAG: mechanosensitive ion channel protein MscS [Gallionellales bacterium 39-52-133]HQS58710.1 mechanosensitive ion channel family protein [Gallionellaceae bacterium]HQS75050.1 mechanosensitive ion channel family protein [Gallionellaceae bacterium]
MKALLQSIGINVSDKWLELLLPSSHILIILILSWLLLHASSKLISSFKHYVTRRTLDAGSIKRAETLAQVFSHVSTLVILLISGMLILGELGISIAPILAAAGVVGLAVGFGAQTLIKDYFNGFFLLIEDQIRHGEVVEIGQNSGLVEEVTLRHVRLRDYSGSVHFIPNSSITIVTNRSRDFSYSVIDIGVAYRENTDEVYELMRKVGSEMRTTPGIMDKIVEDLEIAGINDLADSAVIIRCRFKVLPLEQWGVRREFLYRIKKSFDAAGIEIPYPHLTLYAGQAKQGESPSFKIQSQPMDIN